MTRQHCNSSMIACRIFIDWIYFFLIYFFKSTFSVGNFLIHFFHGLSFKTQKFCKHIELVFDTRNPKGLKCSECKRSTMAWICLNTMLDPCPTPRDHLRPKVLEGVVVWSWISRTRKVLKVESTRFLQSDQNVVVLGLHLSPKRSENIRKLSIEIR